MINALKDYCTSFSTYVTNHTPTCVSSTVYQNRPQTWNLDRAKAPRFNDRKRLSINNTKPFAIVESRELSRGPKSKFVADSGMIKWLPLR